MKIWILSPRCAPDITDDRAVLAWHLARAQARLGHDVTVMAIWCEAQDVAAIKCRPLTDLPPSAHLNGTAYWAWQMTQEILQAVESGMGPDRVYALSDWGLAHILLQEIWTFHPQLKDIPVITIPAKPLLLTAHDNFVPRYRLDFFWAMEMERFTLKASRQVLTYSPVMSQTLEIPSEMQQPLSLEGLLDPVSEPATFNIERLVIIGPVEPASQIDLWIRALLPLWTQGLAYSLDVIGPDTVFPVTRQSYRTMLEEKFPLAVANGWIRFINPDANHPLSANILASALLLYGCQEPVLSWPLVLAAQAKTPVLALESVRAQEILGPGHILVPPLPGLMSNAINDMLKNPAGGQAPSLAPVLDSFTPTDEKMLFPFVHPGAKILPELPRCDDKKLSVVIPYYNLGSLIFDALDSVFQSRLIPDEVIVIDDGSDDPDSIEALSRIPGKYPVVQVLRTPNHGIVHARNLGAKKAQYPLVAFLDADDIYAPEYLLRCCAILETYRNVAFVGSWVQYFEANEGVWAGWNAEPPFILYHNTVNSGGIVIRRSALQEAGLNNTDMIHGLEDYESTVHLIAQGYRGVVIPEPLYRYRVRKNSRTRVHVHDDRWIYLYDVIRQHHQDMYAHYAEPIMGLLNANGPQYRIDSPLCPPTDFIPRPLPQECRQNQQTK